MYSDVYAPLPQALRRILGNIVDTSQVDSSGMRHGECPCYCSRCECWCECTDCRCSHCGGSDQRAFHRLEELWTRS